MAEPDIDGRKVQLGHALRRFAKKRESAVNRTDPRAFPFIGPQTGRKSSTAAVPCLGRHTLANQAPYTVMESFIVFLGACAATPSSAQFKPWNKYLCANTGGGNTPEIWRDCGRFHLPTGSHRQRGREGDQDIIDQHRRPAALHHFCERC